MLSARSANGTGALLIELNVSAWSWSLVRGPPMEEVRNPLVGFGSQDHVKELVQDFLKKEKLNFLIRKLRCKESVVRRRVETNEIV